MRVHKIQSFLMMFLFAAMSGCTSDPPEPSGRFTITFSGGLNEQLQGNASFELIPGSTNGRIIVRLEESSSRQVRLTFFNPDPAQIFLEPGTYTVVDQAGLDVENEVLADYVSPVGTFSATSGEIRVGVVKDTQIKGNLVNVEFTTLNITANGNFDAIPQ